MINLFTLLKKIFNVDNVEAIDDAMIEAYYNATDEEQTTEEAVENSATEEQTDDKPADEVTPPTPPEEVIEEVPATPEVAEVEVPVETADEQTVEDTADEQTADEDKDKEVLTKDVINNATSTNYSCKENLMALKGDAFFNALHKQMGNLKGLN